MLLFGAKRHRAAERTEAATYVIGAYLLGIEIGSMSSEDRIRTCRSMNALHQVEAWADEVKYGHKLGCSGVGCDADCKGR